MPIYKNSDVQSFNRSFNYRRIKLKSHTMKIWKRVAEAWLKQEVEMCEQHYGLMPGKNTTDAIFALIMLKEKYR